jgi:hypothetical protein
MNNTGIKPIKIANGNEEGGQEINNAIEAKDDKRNNFRDIPQIGF